MEQKKDVSREEKSFTGEDIRENPDRVSKASTAVEPATEETHKDWVAGGPLCEPRPPHSTVFLVSMTVFSSDLTAIGSLISRVHTYLHAYMVLTYFFWFFFQKTILWFTWHNMSYYVLLTQCLLLKSCSNILKTADYRHQISVKHHLMAWLSMISE